MAKPAPQQHQDLWGFEQEGPPAADLPQSRAAAEEAWAKFGNKYMNPDGKAAQREMRELVRPRVPSHTARSAQRAARRAHAHTHIQFTWRT